MNTPKLIAIFLAVFAITSHADTAEQLKTTIESFSSGTGSLTATVDGNTVTVTGSKTGVAPSLTLNIDSDVSVIWKATITGNYNSFNFGTIRLSGTGSFEVQSGGTVSATSPTSSISAYAIYNVGAGMVNISGGTVEGLNNGNAVYNDGIIFISGGTVTGYKLNNGIIVEWNKAANNTEYTALSNDDITALPSSATATWNGRGGIAYAKGENTGFIPIEGVTVSKVKITEPTVTNTALVYTGSEQSAGIAANAAYTVTGDKEATNAGDYAATLVLDKDNFEWSDGTDDDLSLLWAIAKAKIAKPSVTNTSLVYTGSEQSAGIAANAAYTVTGDKGTAVNSYTATVALNDKANYEWADGTTADLSLPWAISAPLIDPILPQIAGGSIRVQATANAIMLENLPRNAKVQVYTLQGKQIYSANSDNSQILRIPVQTKGMYIVKAGSQTLRVAVR